MGVGAATAVVLGGLFVVSFIFVAIFGTAEGNLQKRFAELGNLRGRTRQEIVAAVGNPNSISQMADGKTLLQWMRTSSTGGYHVGLLFDAFGICEGVTHEHNSNA